MRIIKKTISALSVIGLLGMTAAVQADRADDYLCSEMAKRHIPGLSVVVVQNGSVVKSVTPDSVYQLASLTKQFTAAAIIKLAQDGKLRVDDPIDRYLPGTPALWDTLTIRQLLNQTSGLPNFLEGMTVKDLRKEYTPTEIIQRIAERPLGFMPGTQYAYSNTNYYLLGVIIEKASGFSYGQYLRQTFFTPLTMTQTRLYGSKDELGSLWDGHTLKRSPFVYSPSLQFGYSGVLSTVGDLVKWNAALHGDRLLTPASKMLLWTPPILPGGAGTQYASGWLSTAVHGHKLIWHNGALPTGYSGAFFRFPDDGLAVIVLSNQFDSSGKQDAPMYALTLGLAKLYLPALQDAPPAVDPDPKMTAKLRQVIADLSLGKIDRRQFTSDMNAVLTPAVLQKNSQTFAPLGPLQSPVFLSRSEDNGLRVYQYRAVFGETPIVWTLTLTTDGKVAGVESHGE